MNVIILKKDCHKKEFEQLIEENGDDENDLRMIDVVVRNSAKHETRSILKTQIRKLTTLQTATIIHQLIFELHDFFKVIIRTCQSGVHLVENRTCVITASM